MYNFGINTQYSYLIIYEVGKGTEISLKGFHFRVTEQKMKQSIFNNSVAIVCQVWDDTDFLTIMHFYY